MVFQYKRPRRGAGTFVCTVPPFPKTRMFPVLGQCFQSCCIACSSSYRTKTQRYSGRFLPTRDNSAQHLVLVFVFFTFFQVSMRISLESNVFASYPFANWPIIYMSFMPYKNSQFDMLYAIFSILATQGDLNESREGLHACRRLHILWERCGCEAATAASLRSPNCGF